MEIKASLNHLRLSPRKARIVANMIKGMGVGQAQDQLRFSAKEASRPILKLLNSAIANAEHNFKQERENLYVKSIAVNQGTSLKRWMPRAFGRASPILKRASHINLILEAKPGMKKAKKAKSAGLPAILRGAGREDAREGGMEPGELSGEIKKADEGLKDQEKKPYKQIKAFEKTGKVAQQRLGAVRKIFQRKSI